MSTNKKARKNKDFSQRDEPPAPAPELFYVLNGRNVPVSSMEEKNKLEALLTLLPSELRTDEYILARNGDELYDVYGEILYGATATDMLKIKPGDQRSFPSYLPEVAIKGRNDANILYPNKALMIPNMECRACKTMGVVFTQGDTIKRGDEEAKTLFNCSKCHARWSG